jgi:heme O synthase-like polyprenyltransferase
MLPVIEGVRRSSLYTALSNVLLFPFTTALFFLTANWSSLPITALAGFALVALNAKFVAANIRLARDPSPFTAWKVFKLSAQYLFLTLILIVIGHIL